jgi:hypothetical protein
MVVTRKEGRSIYYSLTDRKTALIEAIFSHIQPEVTPTLAPAVTPSESRGACPFVKTGVVFSASQSCKNLRQL